MKLQERSYPPVAQAMTLRVACDSQEGKSGNLALRHFVIHVSAKVRRVIVKLATLMCLLMVVGGIIAFAVFTLPSVP